MADPVVAHVVDDDEGVRRTLAYLLGSGHFAPKLYASAEAFIEARTYRPEDVVLVDVRLPGMSGLELVSRVKAAPLSPAVVVMSGAADVDMAVAALKFGAADFIQKPFRAPALVATLTEAMERERRPQLGAAAQSYRKVFDQLSPRQRDVLRGILEGKLNKTIAHELGISVRTVEGYRAELMAKTETASLTELIRKAVLAGF